MEELPYADPRPPLPATFALHYMDGCFAHCATCAIYHQHSRLSCFQLPHSTLRGSSLRHALLAAALTPDPKR